MVKVNAYLIAISWAVPVLLQVLNISLTFSVGSADVRDKATFDNVGSKVDQFGNTVD